jgi:hypothetical protein
MGTDPITTRLNTDTKQQMERYAEDREIGQTEAMRRLVRQSLAAEGYDVASSPTTNTETLLDRLSSHRIVTSGIMMLVVMALGVGQATLYLEASRETLGYLTIAVSAFAGLSGTVMLIVALLAQLALAEPLSELVFGATTDSTDS